MTAGGLRIVVLGLSLSSSWGNGHATTYRALLKSLARRGHAILFLERDVPWYAANRDLSDPPYCRLELYASLDALRCHAAEVAAADAVIVGSYVPDGSAVVDWVLATARGATAFYDIDTPVTLAALGEGSCAYLRPDQVGRFGAYLSFTGGPTLAKLMHDYGAREAHALYCSVDVEAFAPRQRQRRWDLGYLGTYSADRQPALERLLIEPARRLPDRRFIVAGAQFPPDIVWPANVERVEHLAPGDLPAFYSSLGWALNVTRAEMVRAGFSPSVRLFEAAACGAPLISDAWAGLETILAPGEQIVVAGSATDVCTALAMPEARRTAIAAAARAHILVSHSSDRRAEELESILLRLPSEGARAGLERASRTARAGTDQPQTRCFPDGPDPAQTPFPWSV
jgi:spore maturation protein CgeB